MNQQENLVGRTFGDLVVLRFFAKSKFKGRSACYCKCKCGNEKLVKTNSLKTDLVKSCGCRTTRAGNESRTPLYKLWVRMRARCSRRTGPNAQYYALRGIKVCDDWQTFSTFRAWALKHGYKQGLFIDRTDVNGDYKPGNCRFVTIAESNRNKTTNKLYDLNGRRMLKKDMSRELKIPWTSLCRMLDQGTQPERLLGEYNKRKRNRK